MATSSTASAARTRRNPQSISPATHETDDRGARRALELVQTNLVPGEALQSYAIQRRIHALLHRRTVIAATNGRLIILSRGLLGGYDTRDVRWQDLKDARISAGPLSASLSISSLGQPDLATQGVTRWLAVLGLRKEQAQAVYRICQANEQSWREKRRIRELEELRAKSGGVQVSTGISPAPQDTDPVQKLQKAKDMLDKGLINDAEYESLKARVVSAL